jgi:predicted transcriptional regulator of viral defense system
MASITRRYNANAGANRAMKLIDAQAKLISLNRDIIQTADAASCLNISRVTASQILKRLAAAKILIPIARGLWAISDMKDPLRLPEFITTPYASYISLQTALFYHGMISQIPATTYAVTLSRTRKYKTPLGTISLHRIAVNFFFGYDQIGDYNIKMATPEKALLDTLYLSTSSSAWFKKLPELEIPKGFKFKLAFEMIEKIPSLRLRTIVKSKLDIIYKQSR